MNESEASDRPTNLHDNHDDILSEVYIYFFLFLYISCVFSFWSFPFSKHTYPSMSLSSMLVSVAIGLSLR